MTRRIKFDSYANHAWFNRIFKKLTQNELEIAHAFIDQHNDLDVAKFEYAVNRMFLDNPNKPKHFKEILELLTCANCAK